jgi:hypothetical protein
MGKLLEKYTQPAKEVEFKFPLSEDKLMFVRPSQSEARAIAEFSSSLVNDDIYADIKMSAKIMKMLVPEFADESEKSIADDLKELETPDKAAILPFYFKLLGIEKEELRQVVTENLSTTTKS